MKVIYICQVCGNKSATLDAWAEWEESAQEWTLGAAFGWMASQSRTWTKTSKGAQPVPARTLSWNRT